ncbi:unnamed protein product [Schistosoma margrebowiei]|uniref:Uncharacterized protein n=1 Tax=Schistosoma margrebowiei TaxID=48269 RepID=A0AA85AJC7_9TREM|nr:unnamed protein product [Schistosoma margrebowiei]
MQRIRLNQPRPHFPKRFENLDSDKKIVPKFRFKFGRKNVKKFRVKFTGAIDLLGPHYLGTIGNFLNGWHWSKSRILNKNQVIEVTTMLHSTGKISVYYDEIPHDLGRYKMESIVEGVTYCKRGGIKY